MFSCKPWPRHIRSAMLIKGYCMAQAAEMSLAWTYVCDSEMLMALAVMRARQAAVRTAKALAGVKCMSRTPEITKAR